MNKINDMPSVEYLKKLLKCLPIFTYIFKRTRPVNWLWHLNTCKAFDNPFPTEYDKSSKWFLKQHFIFSLKKHALQFNNNLQTLQLQISRLCKAGWSAAAMFASVHQEFSTRRVCLSEWEIGIIGSNSSITWYRYTNRLNSARLFRLTGTVVWYNTG